MSSIVYLNFCSSALMDALCKQKYERKIVCETEKTQWQKCVHLLSGLVKRGFGVKAEVLRLEVNTVSLSVPLFITGSWLPLNTVTKLFALKTLPGNYCSVMQVTKCFIILWL